MLQSDWFKNAIPFEDQEVFYSTYGLQGRSDRGGPDLIEPLRSSFLTSFIPAPSTELTQALQFSYDVDENTLRRLKTIDIIIYWVNIIRASLTNYSKNPVYGPPIVRLNHGIMYQDIPCICTNYDIRHNEAAGHDLRTLLPLIVTGKQ